MWSGNISKRKSWIIEIVHRTCVNQCGTGTLPSPRGQGRSVTVTNLLGAYQTVVAGDRRSWTHV